MVWWIGDNLKCFSLGMSFCQQGLNSVHTDSVNPAGPSLSAYRMCVLLYLFIHVHVAKHCQYDELQLEPANCFHSTGQVSHALNLNVLLVIPLLFRSPHNGCHPSHTYTDTRPPTCLSRGFSY